MREIAAHPPSDDDDANPDDRPVAGQNFAKSHPSARREPVSSAPYISGGVERLGTVEKVVFGNATELLRALAAWAAARI